MLGGFVENDRLSESDRRDLEIGAVAQALFERDPYRELSAMLLTLRSAVVIRGLARREPLGSEVAYVAGRVVRASSPEEIARELLAAWPESMPRCSEAHVSLVTMAEFDNALWRMFLMNPDRSRATAADVVTIAARVWPLDGRR